MFMQKTLTRPQSEYIKLRATPPPTGTQGGEVARGERRSGWSVFGTWLNLPFVSQMCEITHSL